MWNLAVGALTFMMLQHQLKGKEELSFGTKLQIKQHISGRIRVYCESLKVPQVGGDIQAQLSKISAILGVSVNPVTGSLLIHYDEKRIQPEMMVAAIYRLLEIASEEEKKESLIKKEVKSVHDAIDYALLDRSNGWVDLETLLPITFVTLAVKGMVQTGSLGTPAPMTLLYWAYHMLNSGRE